ncbi:MAG TPA: hypothetical protein VGU44_04735 [Gammaproteobacteria bacterium]|nr:hypothetical protein [Gammaproteobacteria bacterium]
MNTTALYLLSINDSKQLPFFSPYYGDPTSVAKRFLQMQHDKCFDKSYATRFLRANADVEFARDHNVMSDYIYTLNNQGQLRASAYLKTGWDVFFEGAMEDFIDQYEGF